MAEATNDPMLETQTTSKDSKGKPPVLLILLILLLAVAIAALGYLYWQLQDSQRSAQDKDARNATLQKSLADCVDKKPAEADDLPVIVFTPAGQFTDPEKAEITAKMLNPYKAWHRDLGDNLVSIHVQQPSSGPREYLVDVIHRDGVYEGFTYGTIDAATQPWWHPVCLDACEFTPAFRAAYPDVVAGS